MKNWKRRREGQKLKKVPSSVSQYEIWFPQGCLKPITEPLWFPEELARCPPVYRPEPTALYRILPFLPDWVYLN